MTNKMGRKLSIKYSMVFLAFAIILGSYGVGNQAFADDPPEDHVSLLNGVEVTYKGCNASAECTWNFFNESHNKAVSHSVVGLSTCAEFFDGTILSSSGPETDPTTGVFGIKWDTTIKKGEQQDFTIKFLIPVDITLVDHGEFNPVAVKAGPREQSLPIHGPLCTPDVFPPTLSIESVTAKTASIAFNSDNPPVPIITPGTDFTTTGTTDVNDNRLLTVDAS